MKERKEKILDDGDEARFVPSTKNLGRAEFMCCPVFKRGKLRELYLHPAQQEDIDYYYKVEFPYPPLDFSIMSLSYKGIEEPRIWIHFWCKEHKCHSFRFYVPPNANKFTVSKLSNFSIIFDWGAL